MNRLKQWLGFGRSKDEHERLNIVIDQQGEYIAKLEAENTMLWEFFPEEQKEGARRIAEIQRTKQIQEDKKQKAKTTWKSKAI